MRSVFSPGALWTQFKPKQPHQKAIEFQHSRTSNKIRTIMVGSYVSFVSWEKRKQTNPLDSALLATLHYSLWNVSLNEWDNHLNGLCLFSLIYNFLSFQKIFHTWGSGERYGVTSIFDKHREGSKQFQISWLTLHMGKHILKPLPSISVCVYLTSFAQEQVCGKSGRTTFRPTYSETISKKRWW